jgi:hypothetical protein
VIYDTGTVLCMNSADGNIISSKRYVNMNNRLHKLTKALLINSIGNAAYVLNNGPTSGYQILRYNPSITATQNAVWAYKFTGNPWGIVFGS